MSHVVSQEWLFEHGTDDHIVIVDCRFALGNPTSGRKDYEADHIPGAFYLDLEEDLSAPKAAHGGRHPLPDVEKLAAKLGAIGVDAGAFVVAYDDQGGAMASRLWWLLAYMGHERAAILDGGYTRWKEAGYPVTDEPPVERAAEFRPRLRPELVLSMDDVKQRLGRPGTVLIDSREPRRYAGLEEAIDPVAGHIPGAKNRFWKDGLTEGGLWRPAAEQADRFADLKEAEEIVVYCGSGVTACPNVLALQQAGFGNVKLYAGSWSDWVSYSENPVATGEE
ncbi:thiosulfate/3-mercaptopyruvate sulfurtransferase [Paenibacillus sp. UNCCL117]|uniref:sulfurtransferase n=1 Tax=unclassified Paenibacillus TaxID=185978 RepID=UPI0008921A16|nr:MULTISPECIES: sulfurtransferase [unclassified Paenibacillus]SDD16450.1 thiosulfate/3-mercaptopyruvate sulfurtransferase [Paenibacillus sp. cl123]SFW34711.1 thiosulfate/3-mercaptopyruvate sulfurtransferase [Paenibacillus sp. UNCCL117]